MSIAGQTRRCNMSVLVWLLISRSLILDQIRSESRSLTLETLPKVAKNTANTNFEIQDPSVRVELHNVTIDDTVCETPASGPGSRAAGVAT